MKVRLSQGREARARRARKPTNHDFPTHAANWPRFIQMLGEDGVLDVDARIELYGFRLPGLDYARVDGGRS